MALKVLLADDNLTAQRMGSKILTDAGHTVVAVSNGAAAMKKVASEKPELIIVDVYMPGYSGLEVCQKVKDEPATARVPVLLTVTNMEPYNAEDGHRVKADGLLIKPFEATDLLAIVKKFEEKLHAPAPAPDGVDTQKIPAVQEFEDASYTEWKAEAAPEKDTVAKGPEMSAEVASAPVLGIDDLAPAEPTPAFSVESAAPFPVQAPAEAAAPAFDVNVPARSYDFNAPQPLSELTPPPAFELEHAEAGAQPEVSVAPPPELEFTSARHAADIDVAPAPELEVTSQPQAGEIPVERDAALVTDPSDLAQFATKFGEEHPEDVPVGIAMPEEPKVQEIGLDEILAEPALSSSMASAASPQPAPSMTFNSGAAAAAAPARLSEPEIGVDTQPIEVPAAVTVEEPMPAAPEPKSAAYAEPSEAFAAEFAAAKPAPVAEAAVGSEPEEPSAPQPHQETGDITQKLVAQFAAELDAAQHEKPPEPETHEPEMEPPAEAAVAPSEDQRVSEAVTRVLERYKGELIAAIVRELKG